ncbi:UPAR/Ly6 domain-containing protein bou isoform X1 [Panulirus ornatus]|uniref:UPAR/Ly6 domain-containing protein bou isoform X1 n=1 Tax=Panulirus ornatus TaxID=150431 RepID=UPI003A87FAFD
MDILKFTTTQVTFLTLSFIFIAKNASGLRCYECDSNRDPYCPEHFHTDYHQAEAAVTLLTSGSCDHVFEARYCVKTTGMFEGELGTKRFCSARDWGNYCQWVTRPGDEREYRACVFTCWGNSCNGAHATRTPTLLLLLVPALILTFHRAWP